MSRCPMQLKGCLGKDAHWQNLNEVAAMERDQWTAAPAPETRRPPSGGQRCGRQAAWSSWRPVPGRDGRVRQHMLAGKPLRAGLCAGHVGLWPNACTRQGLSPRGGRCGRRGGAKIMGIAEGRLKQHSTAARGAPAGRRKPLHGGTGRCGPKKPFCVGLGAVTPASASSPLPLVKAAGRWPYRSREQWRWGPKRRAGSTCFG